MKFLAQLGGMGVAAALMAAGTLCINASKVNGKMLYTSETVMLLVELLKGCICAMIVAVATNTKKLWLGWGETMYFAAPALLYTIDNNLVFVILRFIDPATLSILWNLKIFTTAVLFKFVLRRSISHLQVVSLVLLMLGVATTQSRHDAEPMLQHHQNLTSKSNANAAFIPKDSRQKFVAGLGLVAIACVISSLAGIVTEYALKKRPDTPFVLQNLYLAFFSACFNAIGVVVQMQTSEDGNRGFFDGYNAWTWTVVAIQVFAGLSMGLILKFLDNIACVYTHAMAMMLTTLVSILFFSFELTLEFACGFCVCVVSMYLYHLPMPGSSSSSTSHCHVADEEYEKLARSPMSAATLESPCSLAQERDSDLSPRDSTRRSSSSDSEA